MRNHYSTRTSVVSRLGSQLKRSRFLPRSLDLTTQADSTHQAPTPNLNLPFGV